MSHLSRCQLLFPSEWKAQDDVRASSADNPWSSLFLSLGSHRGNPTDKCLLLPLTLSTESHQTSVPSFREKKKKSFSVSLLGEFWIELFKERVHIDMVFKMANSFPIEKSEKNSDKKSISACEQTRWLHTPSSSLLVFTSPPWEFLRRKTR